MKIRSLRPEFFSDKKMATLSPYARLLYAALWCIVDDEGRGRYLPKQIEGEAFPYEEVDVASLLSELVELGRIVVYEDDGEKFFHIPTFGAHQRPNRIVDSRLPAPSQSGNVDTAAALREQCLCSDDAPSVVVVVEGEVEVEVEVGGVGDAAMEPFAAFWSVYPNHTGRRTAEAKFRLALNRVDGDLQRILDGARRYRNDPNRSAQFTAHAATWLNRDGWDDPPLPSRNGSHREGDDLLNRELHEAFNQGALPS